MIGRAAAAAGLAALLTAGAASAQTVFKDFGTLCTMSGSFTVCAEIVVVRVSSTTYQLHVQNTGVDPHLIAAIGLYDPTASFSGTYVSGPTGWASGPGAAGLGGGIDFKVNTTAGANRALVGCNNPYTIALVDTCSASAIFTFNITGTLAANNLQVRWHARSIGGPADYGSAKCDSADPSCFTPPPPTVVPEPITTALLGTGLAALGGVGLRRRRRGRDVENG